MRGRVSVAAVLWLACACTVEPRLLVVDLISDLRPSSEVVEARTTLLARDDAELLGEVTTPLGVELDLVGGARIAELEVQPGTYQLRVELLDRDREVAAERVTFVDVTSDRVATMVLTRSCVGVDCSSDPAAIATCFGGGCVDPTCSPETPELCPPPECTTDADCPGVTCLGPVCVAGACGLAMPARPCAPGMLCDAAAGCVCDTAAGCDCALNEDLVVALSFEDRRGSLAPSGPPGLDATLSTDATISSSASGPCGAALDLSIANASATLPVGATLDAAVEGDFTLVTWIRSAQPVGGGFPSILSKEDAAPPRLGPNLVLHGSASDPVDPTWYFEIYDSEGAHQARGGMVSDDTWHQLVGVRQGSDLRAFEDGVLIAEVSTGVARPIRNALALTLGTKPARGGNYSYDGYVDEVRVFDRALTAEEVMALYLDQSTGCACQ